jgi:hypothetical protein
MTKTRLNRNKIIFSFGQRWPWGCLLFFCIACSHSNGTNFSSEKTALHLRQVDSTRALITTGDLIFRNGTDDISRAARSFNRIDTSFSHCGIVLVEMDTVFVYHALGGDYNPDQKLKREPLTAFCSPPVSDKFAIYRFDMQPGQVDSRAAIVKKHYRAGLPFDMFFNFESDDKMYCSEFVFKCLNKSLSDSLSQSIRARPWPFGISPDDLFLHPRSRLIIKVEF